MAKKTQRKPHPMAIKPPRETADDVLYTLSKSLTASAASVIVPVFGPAAVDMLSTMFRPPIERRTAEFWQDVANKLTELESRISGFELHNLAHNEQFITVAFQATRIAVGTHQQGKREALRNALLNTALEEVPDEDLQLTFVRYIDELTPSHITVLRYMDVPDKTLANAHASPIPQIDEFIDRAFPEIVSRGLRALQILADLENRGLAETRIANTKVEDLYQRRSTDMGRRFLEFISAPSSDR